MIPSETGCEPISLIPKEVFPINSIVIISEQSSIPSFNIAVVAVAVPSASKVIIRGSTQVTTGSLLSWIMIVVSQKVVSVLPGTETDNVIANVL